MKKVIISLIGLLAIFAFSSCQKDGPAENGTIPTGVTIAESVLNLVVHETKAIDFTTTPSNANTSELVWTSADETIATVKEGMVTGIKDGSTNVVVSLFDHEAKAASATPLASITVKVSKKAVTSVTISKTEATIINGKTLALTAKAVPADASFLTITWSSSDEKVATVKDGTVTAKKAGTCVITAAGDGNIKATCAITVIDADDFKVATDASAGSKKIVGGDQDDIAATGDNFLSYSKATQTVSWTENTTGKNRKASLELSSGSKIEVIQAAVKASSFKGTWSFRTQRFSNNTTVCAAAADVTIDVTIQDAKFGETLPDHDGTIYTNSIGLKGLYLDAVADAVIAPGKEGEAGVKFGLFLDERKAQAVANGNATYPYVCFIPECGTAWSSTTMAKPWNFVPIPISSDQNYQWLWFDVKEDYKTLQYDHPYKQYLYGMDGKDGATIIGITCAVAKNATPAAADIYGTYNVIYQANPGKDNAVGGFMLTKK